MLKSYTAKKMFENFPGFRKRYPHAVDSGADTSIMSPQDGKAFYNQQPTSAIKHDTIMRTSSMKNSNNYQPERDRRAGIRQDRRACRGSEGGTGDYKGTALISFLALTKEFSYMICHVVYLLDLRKKNVSCASSERCMKHQG